jgi:hypothetical protein
VHGDEADDDGHADKVLQAHGLKATQQGDPVGKLHRFPDEQSGDDLRNSRRDDHDVKQLLHRVVDGQILVLDAQMHGVADGLQHLAHANRQEAFAEAAGEKPINQIRRPVDGQEPHSGEMPQQARDGPAAETQGRGKVQPGHDHIVVINTPAGGDHDEHGGDIDPVHDPHGKRMQAPVGLWVAGIQGASVSMQCKLSETGGPDPSG